MTEFNAYIAVITTSLIIILSYLFNLISKKTSIPSVLLLVILGLVLKEASIYVGVGTAFVGVGSGAYLFSILEVLGIVGLTMIVLEAALDLELTREKWPIIWKSFSVALLGLVCTSFGSAYIIQQFFVDKFFTALVYAVPLSVISSSIVLPSVGDLDQSKKEFLVYEATFSDILGIMFFYFLIGNLQPASTHSIVLGVVANIVITIFLSAIVSYFLVLLFQKLDTQVKLFLLISVLLLLYSAGKLLHLSSLLLILVFGLVLNNHKLFFFGKLRRLVNSRQVNSTLHNFRLVTMESAFVIRTFFFVIFGMTITLSTILSWSVALVSALILTLLYAIRFIFVKLFVRRDITTPLFIAPRGLITILLFFSIPVEMQTEQFNSGVLLFVILLTGIIMTLGLILGGNTIQPYQDFASNYWQEVDKEIDNIETSENTENQTKKQEIV